MRDKVCRKTNDCSRRLLITEKSYLSSLSQLLGMPSHDIDIAVNNMMGFEFASHVNNYLKFIGHETRTIAKIDSNPEKSKHLETATTKVLGLDIDFVNLRNEVYNEDSRIPVETVSSCVDACRLKLVGLGRREV